MSYLAAAAVAAVAAVAAAVCRGKQEVLKAEQLLLQLLRSRAGSKGVTEDEANDLLTDVENSSSSSSSSLTGRRLQQLGDYLFRVLLRVHADAAAAAEESEEEAMAAAADQPDILDDDWEVYL
ncbi:hypothetical protein, conserved [Eimeria maxima]|uniref:Uncharacterized protein n=1 Tax=Eimeria maxima TaxID=5804 RepID=U6M363_EIMMA|nr:hypothetical protein, conserved [Eimeria maxima]CDJ58657.1 hypothetical protein, conserved [Eimeria maxima]